MKTLLLLSMVLLSGCASFRLLPPEAPIVTDPQNRPSEVVSRDFEQCRYYGLSVARTESGAAVAHNNCLSARGYNVGGQ